MDGKNINESNVLGKFYTIFNTQDPIKVTLPVLKDKLGQSRIYTKEKDKVPRAKMVHELVAGYFGRDIYVLSGFGYKSLEDFKQECNGDAHAAVDAAINSNRIRCLNEKNFFFCGDKALRHEILETYIGLASGVYDPVTLEALKALIRIMRVDAEVEARVSMMRFYNPKADLAMLKQEAISKIGAGEQVDLQAEIHLAQKTQLAQTINAKALELVLGGCEEIYRAKIRLGSIADYINECLQVVKNIPKESDSRKLAGYVTGLPVEQRTPLIIEIVTLANELCTKQHMAELLLKPEQIQLDKLHAHYTASMEKNADKELGLYEANTTLDQLRSGMVMHLVSDSMLATGLSIKSVHSTQQAIVSNDDALNNMIDTWQLHGRTVLDSEACALNQQVVGETVSNYFKLSDLLHRPRATFS
ncbi:MAG: hypothetical protein WC627_04350 [Legionella sp.]|jgi:hypothetical protein